MKKIIFVFLSIFLVGCAGPIRLDNVVVDNTQDLQINNDLTGKITVTYTTGGRDSNPMWAFGLSNQEFKKALQESLQSYYLLAVETNPIYELSATVMKVDYPHFGSQLTFRSNIRYVLVNKDTQHIVFDKIIESSGEATLSDAFIAAKRLKIASERSIHANIEKFIIALKQVDVNQ